MIINKKQNKQKKPHHNNKNKHHQQQQQIRNLRQSMKEGRWTQTGSDGAQRGRGGIHWIHSNLSCIGYLRHGTC